MTYIYSDVIINHQHCTNIKYILPRPCYHTKTLIIYHSFTHHRKTLISEENKSKENEKEKKKVI
jgi:hypothetical protein